MSIRAVAWALDVQAYRKLSHLERLVLIFLADYADAGGRCYPAQSTIAERLDVHERTVRRAVDALEEMGLLTKVARRRHPGRRGQGTILYKLTVDNCAEYRTAVSGNGQRIPDKIGTNTGHSYVRAEPSRTVSNALRARARAREAEPAVDNDSPNDAERDRVRALNAVARAARRIRYQ